MRRVAWMLVAFSLALAGAVYGMVPAHVTGVLVSHEGTACAEASLAFVNLESNQSTLVETDGQGHFKIELQPGAYDVFQCTEGSRTHLTSLNLSTEEVTELQLTAAGTEVDLESLEAIRDYEVATSGNVSQGLADVINPFPARRQGKLYGSVYWFHRNDNFDARNFFDPVGEPLPEYKRNQFGGTLGAFVTPTFSLQGSFDGLRIIQGSTLLSHVPTGRMKTGDFSELETQLIDPLTGNPFPGNIIPDSRIDPVSKRLLSVLPDPNRSDPDRNFVNNDPRLRNQNQFTLRSDYRTQDNSSLVGEYYFTGEQESSVRPLPAFNRIADGRHQEASIAYSRTVSERLILYGRLQYNRNRRFSLSTNAGKSGLLESLGINGLAVEDPLEEGYPDFDVTGYADFGDSNSPSTSIRNRLGFDGSFTYVFNNHTFRGGLELSTNQLNNYRSDGLHRGSFAFTGLYTGDGFGDFLLGGLDAGARGIGSDRVDLRRMRWEVFVRDQWRLTPGLDLSYGLILQHSPHLRSVHDNVSGFQPLLFEPPREGEIVIAGTSRAEELGFGDAIPGTLLFGNGLDWVPQLGFAYRPLGNNQMVVRANYSINYDSPGDWYYVESLSRNYPFFFVESVNSSGGSNLISLEDPFLSETVPELTVRGMGPWLENAYIHYWRLSFENEVARNWKLGASYSGRSGNRMTRTIPGNIPLPGQGSIDVRRPNPAYGRFRIVNDGGRFSGHSLDISAERRFSGGLSLRSGFEWNRYFDDAFWGDPQNPRDLRSEMAAASWVANRRFFLNYIFDIPFRSLMMLQGANGWIDYVLDGWRLSGVTAIQDGRPFTVVTSGDPNNDGVFGDRPDRISSGLLPSDQRSIDSWFDTSAFVDAPDYGFGSAGRNVLLAPGYQAWDISVIKQSRLSDGEILELRVELFNAFNQVNFERPNSQYGDSAFGKIFGAERAREIEIALKYSF